MTKLWAKGYTSAEAVESYEAGHNANLDKELAGCDILGTMAHCRMLYSIGILSYDEWSLLHPVLQTLLTEAETKGLAPQQAEEDIHTLIENRLTQALGPIGEKIHTGRSRNDQVLTDLRLYTKERLPEIATAALNAAAAFANFAQTYEWVAMPGYTHMQRAMLSSVGLWAASFAEALLDDLLMLEAAYTVTDQSPLGSAAAYGAPLPLDRALTAKLLGFSAISHNTLTAANSRGKFEAAVTQCLALIMVDLSKFAQDLLIFTTKEFGFMSVDEELCSGSSIMPQKKNLGALEVLRARTHIVIAYQSAMLGIVSGLPSGYNMDYQETKAPLFESLRICAESLDVVTLFMKHTHIYEQNLAAACEPNLFAADRALEMAMKGAPFRSAYREVAAHLDSETTDDLTTALKKRSHIGGPGALELDTLIVRIDEQKAKWAEKQTAFTNAISALVALTGK